MQQNNIPCYQWQQTQWQHCLTLKKQNALPHALLLAGQQGIGKFEFAYHLAQSVLCSQPAEACGICKSCKLFAAKTHPDFILLQATENSGIIKIDTIRQLIHTVAHVPQQAQHKVVILDPAEAMNTAAANALLKTLEEPSSATIFLLLSHQLAGVPATIRSRCQLIKFTPPAFAVGVAWLQQRLPTAQQVELALTLTDNAPLQALQLIESNALVQRTQMFADLTQAMTQQQSLVTIIEQWSKFDLRWVLQVLMSWVTDAIRLKSQLHLRYITNQDILDSLVPLANSLTVTHLFLLLDKLYNARSYLLNRRNVNQQLLLEDVLVSFLCTEKV